mmetsp:Transcript_86669/g.245759  ORF Transcript_86669/g.245759 Transcript_86669/m.245759 type:complete len:283 (+) Transcript_86669:1471-2319(+)
MSLGLVVGGFHDYALEVPAVYHPDARRRKRLHGGGRGDGVHQGELAEAIAHPGGAYLPHRARVGRRPRGRRHGGIAGQGVVALFPVRKVYVEGPLFDDKEGRLGHVVPLPDDHLVLGDGSPHSRVGEHLQLLLVHCDECLQVLVRPQTADDGLALSQRLLRNHRGHLLKIVVDLVGRVAHGPALREIQVAVQAQLLELAPQDLQGDELRVGRDGGVPRLIVQQGVLPEIVARLDRGHVLRACVAGDGDGCLTFPDEVELVAHGPLLDDSLSRLEFLRDARRS